MAINFEAPKRTVSIPAGTPIPSQRPTSLELIQNGCDPQDAFAISERIGVHLEIALDAHHNNDMVTVNIHLDLIQKLRKAEKQIRILNASAATCY